MAVLSSPTLNRLIKEVRIFLNQEDPTNSFWSDSELTVYLNDAVRTYFIEVNERAEGQFDKVTNLNIVSAVETIPLPTDCFEVRALYKKQDLVYKILRYNNNLTDGYELDGGTSSTAYEPYYYFRDNDIVLRPVPQFSETASLQLEYTAFPETMIWGGDTLMNSVSPVFKELLVMYAVYKARIKESSVNGTNTYAAVQQHLSDLYTNFKEAVGLRSKYPQKIKPFTPGY